MASPSRGLILPPRLQPGDKVRFVSPASSPDRESVQRCAELLRGWGLTIDYGTHAFRNTGYLAGTDDERLQDLNTAFRDDSVRAIFTTRGGKGSYRIADQLDFEAARHDPKFLVGFSDITVLHLALWKHCQLCAIHGALMETDGRFTPDNEASLRNALMGSEPLVMRPRRVRQVCGDGVHDAHQRDCDDHGRVSATKPGQPQGVPEAHASRPLHRQRGRSHPGSPASMTPLAGMRDIASAVARRSVQC